MDQERLAVLLSKYVAGETSWEEVEELELAFLAEPGLRNTLELILALKQKPPEGLSPAEEQEMMEKGLQRFKALSESRYQGKLSSIQQAIPSRLPVHSRERGERHAFPRWIAAASLLILSLAGGILYLRHKEPGKQKAVEVGLRPKEMATKYGTRSFIDLPDGSKLWLNAGSKVKYTDGFAGDKRELTLLGEAFFDVKHDPVHPFIIHAGKLDIKVLGTSLNIKAYPGDSTMETTLIKGKVEIQFAGDPQSKIVMRPSEKVVIHTNPAGIPVHPTASAHSSPAGLAVPAAFTRYIVVADKADGSFAETSWIDNKLIFRKETLAELAGKLERWYDIKIRFENDTYLRQRVTGTFKDAKIGEVMDALRVLTGLHYQIAGDTIRIR